MILLVGPPPNETAFICDYHGDLSKSCMRRLTGVMYGARKSNKKDGIYPEHVSSEAYLLRWSIKGEVSLSLFIMLPVNSTILQIYA